MKPRKPFFRLTAIAAMLMALAGGVQADDSPLILMSTTSTENSGLLDYLLPKFEAATGISVRVVAYGTGQALRAARNGDADVLLVHAPAAEKQFIASGHGLKRYPVMYNDFVIVGPAGDPAGVGGMEDAARALARIAETQSAFISRGDLSGTHKAEQRIWRAAGKNPDAFKADWYREVGQGMGATLNMAAAAGAYTLTDRGTWLSFGNRRDLRVLVEGDPRLFNQYSVVLINPRQHPHIKAEAARALADWMASAAGQAAIAEYRVKGEALFVPNARQRRSSAP